MTLADFAERCKKAKTREEFFNLKEEALFCGKTGLSTDKETMFKAGEIFQRYKTEANIGLTF